MIAQTMINPNKTRALPPGIEPGSEVPETSRISHYPTGAHQTNPLYPLTSTTVPKGDFTMSNSLKRLFT